MRKVEREQLRKALDHLEQNPCEWENAMAILYPLAGFQYLDWRKTKGATINIMQAVANAKALGLDAADKQSNTGDALHPGETRGTDR